MSLKILLSACEYTRQRAPALPSRATKGWVFQVGALRQPRAPAARGWGLPTWPHRPPAPLTSALLGGQVGPRRGPEGRGSRAAVRARAGVSVLWVWARIRMRRVRVDELRVQVCTCVPCGVLHACVGGLCERV